MKLDEWLQKNYNYNPEAKSIMKSYIEQWKSWYRGNVRSFHNYYVYNGKEKKKQHRYTMNMAKEISEEWADILWSEKCTIGVENEKAQENINTLINDLDLYVLINNALEKAGALGTEATVVSVYDIISNEDGMTLDVSNAKTRVDLVDVDWIFPLSWNNKGITECAFGSVEYIKGKRHIVLSVHQLNEQGNYVIKNHLFSENNSDLTEVALEQDGSVSEFDTKSNVKWFSIFKPLITNNLFNNSPFGIPYYANSIDNLKSVDISFDALKNEVKDGRKRTFARADMFNYDDGTQKMTFDPEDITIYQLPNGATKDDLIQSDTDNLRTTELIDTLNTQLNILGKKCGFGENYYHFDGTNLTTATAVISSNSKMFRRKKKLEVGYESSIYDLFMAVAYASTIFGTYDITTEGLKITFDDSIAEDKEAESNRGMREVSAGLKSKVEYRMQIYGETEEVAKEKIAEIEASNPSVKDLLGTNESE